MAVLAAACGGQAPPAASSPAPAATAPTPAATAPTATAAAPVAAASAPTATTASAAAGAVLHRPSEEPLNYDLGLVGGGIGIEMANLMFEGLTFFDWETKTVIPAAASKWDVSDDQLTYTFHLLPGLTWNDGSPLTAHDFEYAIKRNLDPVLGGTLTSYMYPIKGAEDYNRKKNPDVSTVAVTAKDDVTLTMTLVGVTPYWPVIMSLWTAYPISKKSIDKGGAKWMEPENILSNGRYFMESWKHDQKMVLARNEKFHGKKPAIQKVEYNIFQNPDAQGLTAFQTGAVDQANVIATNADLVNNDPALSKLRRQVAISGTWHLRLDMSNDKSAIADVNVRKALYLAIDRDLLSKQIMKGLTTPSSTFLSPDIPSANAKAALAGTVADAKQYLTKAGFPDGKGFPGFKLGYVPTQNIAKTMSEALIQMWKDNLGITTATAFAVPTDWRQRIKTEKYDMYFGGWQSDYSDPYDWHNVVFDGDAWQSHWKDPKYLDMIKKASVEPNADKRLQMYSDAETYMIQEQMALIPLAIQGELWVVQPWVQGLKVSPFDTWDFLDAATIASH
jgi:oligopeptide transport system substrate-binding protein